MVNNDFPVTIEAGPDGSGPVASPSGSGRSPGSTGALLTVAEVAALMRVSNMTVYRLIKSGDLPAVRVGHSYRIRAGEVDRYLAARSVKVEGA
jgi:excisionase family DNA binding protein